MNQQLRIATPDRQAAFDFAMRGTKRAGLLPVFLRVVGSIERFGSRASCPESIANQG
jgi:hypothetical protein